MESFAQIYVDYIEPFLTGFMIFMGVMMFLALIAKAKEGKLLSLAETIFTSTLKYTYLFFLYLGMSVLWVFNTIVRVFRVIFATLRDFFISRI